jgi:putative SOS response-associated peptidase YedK
MPVVLQPGQLGRWLSGDMGVEELKPAPNGYLQRWAVSKFYFISRENGAIISKCSSS